MSRVFISHSSANNAEAVAVNAWLVENGWNDIFLDIDPERGLKAGTRWQEALKQAADRCEFVIFLVSPAWTASDWCRVEFLLAKQLNKRIVGVVIDPMDIADLPIEMTSEWQLVDLTSGSRDHRISVTLPHSDETTEVTFSSDGLNRLRFGLLEAGLDARYFAWPPEHDPDRTPYRGLSPLEAEDAGVFFGRDGPVVIGLDTLRGLRDAAPPRLLVILGASGAGKSSFLRAGLLPRLAREDQHFIPLPVLRPERAVVTGEHGLIASLEAALKTFGLPHPRADIRAAIDEGPEKFSILLKDIVAAASNRLGNRPQDARDPTLVLAIDQAEELFLADGADEAKTFMECLRALTSNDAPPAIAIFTIRSDSYEQLQTAPILEELRQHAMSLPPMPKGAYKEVIEGPVHRLEGTPRAVDIEDQLTDKLLTEIEAGGAKDALPLLAFTLERLYREYHAGGALKVTHYDALGGIRGSIEAAVEEALKKADVNSAIPKDRLARIALLRRGLIPWLAGIDFESGTPRRRVARLSEIPVEARPLIDLLVEQRLLSTDVDQDTGETTIEPAHEALLRQWGMLEGWLEEDFEDLATADGVRRAARDWDANNRDNEWLAHTGGRLEQAERVTTRTDLTQSFTATERAYIGAARHREYERKKKEAERQQREVDAARRLARRTTVGLVAASVLALAASAIGYYAFQQKQNADVQTEVARTAEQRAISAQKQAEKSAERADTEAKRVSMALSRVITGGAKEAYAAGDYGTAALLALQALPRVNAGGKLDPGEPHWPEAKTVLAQSLVKGREQSSLSIPTVSKLVALPDGGFLTVSSNEDWFGVDVWQEEDKVWVNVGRLKGTNATVLPSGEIVTSHLGRILFWTRTSGSWAISRILKGHKNHIVELFIGKEGEIVSRSRDRTVRVWTKIGTNWQTTDTLHNLPEHGLTQIFQRSNTQFIAGSDNGLELWERSHEGTWGQPRTIKDSGRGSHLAILDGRWLVQGSRTGTLTLYGDYYHRLYSVRTSDSSEITTLSPISRNQFVTGHTNGTLRFWQAVNDTLIELGRQRNSTEEIVDAIVLGDGRIVTASGKSNKSKLTIWSSTAWLPSQPTGGFVTPLSKDRVLISGSIYKSNDDQLILLDELKDQSTQQVHTKYSTAPPLPLPRDRFAIFGYGGKVEVIRKVNESWQTEAKFKVQTRDSRSGAVALSSGQIAWWSPRHHIQVWAQEGRSWRISGKIRRNGNTLRTVGVMPGNRILTCWKNGPAEIWHERESAWVLMSKLSDEVRCSHKFFPLGTSEFVVSAYAEPAQVWSERDGVWHRTASLQGQLRTVTPDGRVVTTEGTVAKVWSRNANEWSVHATLEGHSHKISSVHALTNGTLITYAYVSNGPGESVVWSKKSQSPTGLIQVAKSRVPRCLSSAQRKKYGIEADRCATGRPWLNDIESIVTEGEKILSQAHNASDNNKKKLLRDAIATFDDAIAKAVVPRQSISARLLKAEALTELKEFDEARTELKKVKQFDSDRSALASKELEFAEEQEKQGDGNALDKLLRAWTLIANSDGEFSDFMRRNKIIARLLFEGDYSLALGQFYPQRKDSVTECDRLSSLPADPMRVANPVEDDALPPQNAIAACSKALQSKPVQPRFLVQRGRALAKAAKAIPGDSEDNRQKAAVLSRQAVADFQAAAHHGYPMAFDKLVSIYGNGRGVETDLERARALVFERLNRFIHCCWSYAARKLLNEGEKLGQSRVRRLLRTVTPWAAALGSDDGQKLLAALKASSPNEKFPEYPKATFQAIPPWLRPFAE